MSTSEPQPSFERVLTILDQDLGDVLAESPYPDSVLADDLGLDASRIDEDTTLADLAYEAGLTAEDVFTQATGVDFLSQSDLDAAADFVRRKLDVTAYDDSVLEQVMNLVAADMVYPRVTGEARGQEIASASQGGRTVEYTASSADRATGNSTHWQKALRLTSGELEEDDEDDFWMTGF